MIKERIEERVAKWLKSLNEKEHSQALLLNAYFSLRRNKPDEDAKLGAPIEEPKTTDEIIDDLMSMMPMTKEVVVGWLQSHEYGMTTVADGTVKWAIWRFVDTTV